MERAKGRSDDLDSSEEKENAAGGDKKKKKKKNGAGPAEGGSHLHDRQMSRLDAATAAAATRW